MIKTFPGTSVNYGPLLPPSGTIADGSLFFKTNFDSNGVTNPPGLYIFGFQYDTNSVLVGDQVGQGWRIASDLANYVKKSGDTVTGNLIFTGVNPSLTLQSIAPGIRFTETDQGVGFKNWLLVADGATFQIQTRDDSFGAPISVFSLSRAGVGALNGSVIWTAANDGAGSSLDADFLDGQHGAYYLNLANSSGSLDINSRTSGALAVSRGGTNSTSATVGGVLYGASSTQLGYTVVGAPNQILQSNGTAQPSWVSPSSLAVSTANSLTTARTISLSGNAAGSVSFNGSGNVTIVTTVNNSAQLAGLPPSAAATPSTVATRDEFGYLYATRLNQGSANSEVTAISQVMVTNGSDGLLRKVSIAALASAVGSAGITGYVAKVGDTMTGSLGVGDEPGDALTVNGISLNWAGSSISTSGPISGALISGTGASLTGDITTYRSAAPTTGVIYLGNSGSRYLFYDGTQYVLNGANLNVGGAVIATGDVIAYSDSRLKKNVVTIANALKKVKALRGVDFERLDGTPSTGVIAQEVQNVFPSVVHETDDGTLGVAYGNLVGVLIEAIKEQQLQIEALSRRIDSLID